MYSRQFAKFLVIPAQAGIHSAVAQCEFRMGSRLRGNDGGLCKR